VSALNERHKRRTWSLYEKSIPQLFLERVERSAPEVAFRYKNNGIYKEVTWGQYREKVEAFCLGLLALGLKPGDRVAFMGDTCPDYFVGDIAALSAGAVTYGIYATCSEQETEYQLVHGGARIFFAENQEYVDKILSGGSSLAAIEHIIVSDMRAMFNYSDPRILSFAEVQEMGRTRRVEQPELFESLVAGIKADALAVFVYTSGTTGPPKAAMHSHRDVMVGQSHPYLEGYPELDSGRHRIVTHLPLAHLVERSIPLYLPLLADLIVHFGEDVESLPETLYEVMPTFFHAVPRVWEKLASQFLVGMERSSLAKRLAFGSAMFLGRRYIRKRWNGEVPGPLNRLGYQIARTLVFKPMLMKAGLSRLQVGLTAGAPISERVQELWHVWGVNLRNIYGITEGTVISCQVGDFPRPGDAGKVVYPKEVRLSDDGEVLVSGPGLFMGYWQDEAATTAALADGWFRTGDIAREEQRNGVPVLRLVDRKKDIMITKGGKNIAPSVIESLLKASPYVSEAILFADDRRYPAALVEIDFETVSEWARKRGLLYSGYTSLATNDAVRALIEKEIADVNTRLARVEQIKKFRILPKELDPEEGGTTPTRKVKRRYVYEMFQELVEGMYREDEKSLATV